MKNRKLIKIWLITLVVLVGLLVWELEGVNFKFNELNYRGRARSMTYFSFIVLWTVLGIRVWYAMIDEEKKKK